MQAERSVTAPLKVFFSYSHRDELFRDELERHLSALKRTGQIENWHDRRISGGLEWRGQIDDNLEAADIILLLISADFLDSDYCFDSEMKRALERHKASEAVVIPIILRPVDFKGLPFTDLQALPTDAIPVTETKRWLTTDEAFRDIAFGIRRTVEKVQKRRLRSFREAQVADSIEQNRILDASVAKEIPQGESRDVSVLVRLETSEGLRVVLERDGERAINERTYTSNSTDIRSKPFSFDVPITSTGNMRMPDMLIKVQAPDCEPPEQSKKIVLPRFEDTAAYSFFIRADREGLHVLNVELIENGYAVAEQMLRTQAVEHQGPKGGSDATIEVVLASVPLRVMCVAKAATASH